MEAGSANIAILHHAGGGNLGDDASVDAVISNIKCRWPDASISIFSMNPGDATNKFGVPSYPIRRHTWSLGYCKPPASGENPLERKTFHRWIARTKNPIIRLCLATVRELAFLRRSRRVIRSFNLMILSGGGQLTDRSGPWGFPYSVFSWLLMAKSACVKCLVLNVGAGPLIRPFSRFFIARALFAADYVSFRDEQSQALARRTGFKGQSCVFPDNVYSLEVFRGEESIQRGQPLVGVAPMPYPVDPPFQAGENQRVYEDLIVKFAEFVSSLVQRSYPVRFFGTDIGVDPGAIEDLRSILQKNHKIDTTPYEPVHSVSETIMWMARMDYIVTCRFHGVVFAHLLNKPVLALSHHPKVAHLMNAIGLSRYCVDIRTFNSTQLAERFDALVSDRDKVKRCMAATLANFRSLLKGQFDELFPRATSNGKGLSRGAGRTMIKDGLTSIWR
jgi:polysaccharide pyruvyl transferase WcaK-like protein